MTGDRHSGLADRVLGDAVPDTRLVAPALAVWVSAWQARLLPPRAVLVVAVVVATAALLLLRRGRTAVAAVCLCAAAGGLAAAARTEIRTSGPVHELADAQAAVTLRGVLVDDPALAGRSGRQVVVARLRVDRVEAAGRTHLVRVPVVVLTSDRSWLGLLPSQHVSTEGRLRPAERGDDVAAALAARGPPRVLSPPSSVQRVAGHLRAGLRAAVAPLPAAERGLLPGLVVGDVSRLDPTLRDDFRTTGLSHLVAVSGTNVAIVVGATLLLARRAGLGLVAAPAVAAVALGGFVVLARPSPSVLRAAVMGTIALVALVSGTRRAALPSLCAAVILLVLGMPSLAAAPGFALSVLATAGLLVLAPRWRVALARRMPAWLADAIAVPAAAQAACGPVVVAISGTLGLLSVPANLLAVPAVAPATVLGVVAALLAPVSMPLAQAIAWVAYLPTAWLVRVARTGAGVPGAGVGWPDGARGALLLAAATGALWLLLRSRARRRVAAAGCAGAVLAAAAVQWAAPAWPPPGWFVVACSVGQGDALAVRAGDGAALLVDAGPDPRAVDRCLRRLDVDALPLVVLTHLHADHVDGLPGALRGRRVGAVQVGPVDEPADGADRVRGWVREARGEVVRAGLGEVRAVGPARWQVLAPGRAYRGTRSDPNNSSLVLRLEVAGQVVLLTGDVEPEAQRDLLASGQSLQADVLKVPHHGSAHQEPAFLDAVGARVAITSVGTGNSYGHPAAETLDRVRAAGARSYRTDVDGDVALVAQAGRLVTVAREGTGTTASPSVGAAGEARGRARDDPPAVRPDRAAVGAFPRGLPGAGRGSSGSTGVEVRRGAQPRARSPPYARCRRCSVERCVRADVVPARPADARRRRRGAARRPHRLGGRPGCPGGRPRRRRQLARGHRGAAR